MKHACLAAALLFVTSLSHSARADDSDFGRPGAYIGVGASRSLNLIENFLDDEPVLDQLEFNDVWGVNARAGYRLTSWFAVEAEYEWLDDFEVKLNSFRLGKVGVQSATVNMRFIAPLWRFQPYFLLGAGGLFVSTSTPFNSLDIDNTSFAGRVGIGIDMYLTEHILVNVGAEGVLSNAKVTLDTGLGRFEERGMGSVDFQLGLGYRF